MNPLLFSDKFRVLLRRYAHELGVSDDAHINFAEVRCLDIFLQFIEEEIINNVIGSREADPEPTYLGRERHLAYTPYQMAFDASC